MVRVCKKLSFPRLIALRLSDCRWQGVKKKLTKGVCGFFPTLTWWWDELSVVWRINFSNFILIFKPFPRNFDLIPNHNIFYSNELKLSCKFLLLAKVFGRNSFPVTLMIYNHVVGNKSVSKCNTLNNNNFSNVQGSDGDSDVQGVHLSFISMWYSYVRTSLVLLEVCPIQMRFSVLNVL